MSLARLPSGIQLDKICAQNYHVPSMLYTETEGEEPTPEDIEEFARRIGIDPKTEPHLVHLARSGLLERLPPEWKPCKDTHRDAWFYYNSKTHVSQWEHPMDAVYKQKVIEARTDHAMNRLQSFDLGSAKPLKSLPPLKKGGGGLAPIGFPPSSLSSKPKLGPLKNSSFSSSDDLSQLSGGSILGGLGAYQRPNSLQPLPFEPLLRKSASLGNGELNGRPEAMIKQKMKQDPGSLGLIKKSGLTLTGTGASFLKSAKPPSVAEPEPGLQYPPPKSVLTTNKESELIHGESSQAEDESRFFRPQVPDDLPNEETYKNGSSKSGSEDDATSFPGRKPLKKQEQNLWSTLNNDSSLRKKSNVKFDLQDPKITFEFPRDESDEENESENSQTDESEEEDDEEIEEEEEVDESDHNSPVSALKIPDFKTTRPNSPEKPVNTITTRVPMNSTTRMPSPTNPISENTVPDRTAIKANMEQQLKEYEAKIQQEQREKEGEIRTSMESSVGQIKSDMEAVIQRMKVQFEAHKRSEVEKARKDMETSLTADLDKIRQEFSEKLLQKKREISEEHENALHSLTIRSQADLENLHSDPLIAQAEKDYETQLSDEIQRIKSTMDQQHRKQIENMKNLHQETIENLKLEFQAEEEKLRQEHSQLISEMLSRFDTEKQSLLDSFQQEQEKIKQEFSEKAMQLTQDFSKNFQQLRHDLEEKMESLQNLNESCQNQQPNSLSDALCKTDALKQELADMRDKYHSLEEKYLSLNKRISNQPGAPLSTPPVIIPNPSLDESFPIHYGHRGDIAEYQSNTFDSGHSGAAESDSSFTSSSSGRGKTGRVKLRPTHPTAEPPGISRPSSSNHVNQDSLSKALLALDELKQQISELKREQRKIREGQSDGADGADGAATTPVVAAPSAPQRPSTAKTPVSSRSRSQKSGKEPESRHTPAHHSSKSANTGSVHNITIPMAAKRSSQAKAPQSTEMPHQIGSEDRKYVDDARDFIKSQKFRLTRAGISFGAPVSTPLGAKHRQDTRSHSMPVRQDSEPSQLQDHHSETESSGVGSLKELSSTLNSSTSGKNKISQDIEGILSSLQQLDGQMKYLWTVVGGPDGATIVAPPPIVPTSMPISRDNKYSPLNPNRLPSGNQALMNSLQAITSPIRNYTVGPITASLGDHVNSLRNRQTRILRQYPLSTDPTYTRTSNRSPSITEKTRDLREWLDKF